MSLHKFAEQVAANGRGDDSLLVHMTPDEVQRLQAFAEANGTTMTINPETGLPEAGFLSDLFKAVAPIALGAFLGPAGAAIGGGMMSAGMAGLAVGGITTLATGSLSRGLMAGLGAYGGAGLGESLMNAGTGAMSQAAGAGLSEEAAQQAVGAKLAAATPMETLTAGYNAATANPSAMGAFAKQNLGNIGYAAAPIMAGAMVPTTTKAPTSSNENYIRQFDFNINPETGKPDPLYGVRSMAPVKANEWKDKTFQGQRDAFRQQNPNPYELGVGSLNQPPQQQQPTQMNTGGIVALAIGGDTKTALEAAYAANDVAKINEIASANKITAADVADTYKGFDTSGIQGLQLYAPPAAPTYNQFTNEQIGGYLTANPNADLAKDVVKYNADPTAVNKYIASLAGSFRDTTDTQGGSGTFGIYKDMVAKGIDPTEYYNAAKAYDPKYGGWDQTMIQKAYNLDKGALALDAQIAKDKTVADPKLGYDKQWAKFMDDNKYSIDDMAQAFGIPKNEVQRRYDAVKAAEAATKVITKDTVVGGTGNDTIVIPPVINNTFDSSTEVSRKVTNPYGNATNPGDLTYNTDGSTTVQPNIPYRPYGGFRGIQEIKDAYTRGGGSLGYTPYVPKTAAEHEAMFNKQTGDSLAAYNYLMGKGANPIKSSVSKLAVPYSEYALGKKTTGLKPITTTTVKGVASDPQSFFDEKAYLAANPDVDAELKSGKSNFGNAYGHWLAYGQKEGRAFTGDYAGYKTAAASAGDSGGMSAKRGGLMRYADGGITGNGQLNLNIPLNLGGAGGANGYNAMGSGSGGGFGGYQGQSNQNSVQQSGMPDFRNQIQGLDAQIQKLPSMMAYNDYGKSISGRPPTADEMAQMEQLRKGFMGDQGFMDLQSQMRGVESKYQQQAMRNQSTGLQQRYMQQAPTSTLPPGAVYANGGATGYAVGGGLGSLGSYSDGGRLLRGPGDGVSDSIPATIGAKNQPARLADGEFVIPARIVSELGNGSTDAGAKKLYAMMDRVQRARGKTTGKNKVAANSRSDKYLPA